MLGRSAARGYRGSSARGSSTGKWGFNSGSTARVVHVARVIQSNVIISLPDSDQASSMEHMRQVLVDTSTDFIYSNFFCRYSQVLQCSFSQKQHYNLYVIIVNGVIAVWGRLTREVHSCFSNPLFKLVSNGGYKKYE